MRPLCLRLALAGLSLLAGCLHRPPPPSPAPAAPAPGTLPPPAAPTADRLADRAMTLNLLYIYVDASIRPASTDAEAAGAARTLALAEAAATTLRDRLRQCGFDVRSAEAAAARPAFARTADQEAFHELYALAHVVAAGDPAPPLARHATHLHPNAPSLLFFAALEGTAPEAGVKHPATPALLGGFIADTTTGEVLWSHRVAIATPLDDTRVRQLSAALVRDFPSVARAARPLRSGPQ